MKFSVEKDKSTFVKAIHQICQFSTIESESYTFSRYSPQTNNKMKNIMRLWNFFILFGFLTSLFKRYCPENLKSCSKTISSVGVCETFFKKFNLLVSTLYSIFFFFLQVTSCNNQTWVKLSVTTKQVTILKFTEKKMTNI